MRADLPRSRPDQLAYLLLLALVALLPWPWGSVGGQAQGLVLALTGAGLLLSLGAQEGDDWPASRLFRASIWLWLLWLGWLLLSLLPLPEPLLRALSPAAAELHAGVAGIGARPAWTLSVEPSASRQVLLSTLGLFGLYLLAGRSICTAGRRRALLAVLALSAGAQALYGIGMTITGSEIGFFERKIWGRGWATGTFVNRNHFAHLMALGAAAALGLLMAQRDSDETAPGWRGLVLRLAAWLMSPAAVWRVLMLVMLAAVVLSQSRMGNVALLVSLVFGVLLWVLLHNRRRFVPALLLLASFAIADIWILDNYYGLDRVVDRIEGTELETEQRLVALKDLAPLFEPYALTGAGGGAFQSVFRAVQSSSLRGLYHHAHNEYAEFLIDHGLFGLGWLLLMGLLHANHALRLLRRRREPTARALALAAACALLAAALHASSDFILHIPALRGWLAVLLGALAATGIRQRRAAAPTRESDIMPTPHSSPHAPVA